MRNIGNKKKKGRALTFALLCAALSAGGAWGCGGTEGAPAETAVTEDAAAAAESSEAVRAELTLEEKAASFRFEALQKIQEAGDWVYFAYQTPDNHYRIYRQTLTGGDRTLLFDGGYTPIADFAIDGRNLYINLEYGNGLWMVDGETLESRELLEAGRMYQSLNVRDGILFLEAPNDEGTFYDRYFYPILEDGSLGDPYVEEGVFPVAPYGEEETAWTLQTADFAVGTRIGSEDGVAYYVTWKGEGRTDGQETPICEGFLDVLSYDETSLYVSSLQEPEAETPVTGEYVIGRFDRRTVQYEELLRIPCRIGLGRIYQNGPYSAAVLEEKVYSLYPAEDGMSDYLAVFERGKEGEPTLLGEAVSRDGLGDLGEVKVGGKNVFCPVCGHRDWYWDQELTLTGTFPGDGAINEALGQIYADWAARAQEYVETSASWDGGCIHESSAVSISSEAAMEAVYDQGRYLNLVRQVYEYGGGAHGNSARESYLFDRQTGARLTLADVLGNSEEEVKTAVADAFCNPPYYNEDEIWKERWQIVYDAAGLDMDFCLSEDGVTFYFGQYEVASYAEGFPAVTIPYGQLDLKIDLSGQ